MARVLSSRRYIAFSCTACSRAALKLSMHSAWFPARLQLCWEYWTPRLWPALQSTKSNLVLRFSSADYVHTDQSRQVTGRGNVSSRFPPLNNQQTNRFRCFWAVAQTSSEKHQKTRTQGKKVTICRTYSVLSATFSPIRVLEYSLPFCAAIPQRNTNSDGK